jgi:hypothetical protein
VYTAASKKAAVPLEHAAQFARMLEERSAELDARCVSAATSVEAIAASRRTAAMAAANGFHEGNDWEVQVEHANAIAAGVDMIAATVPIPSDDRAAVLVDPQPEPEMEDRPPGNTLVGVEVPDAMIDQAFAIWKKRAGDDPLENISAMHGQEVGAAVRAACIEAIAFAAFDDISEQKAFPARLIRSANANSSDPESALPTASADNLLDTHQADLEGQVRNCVRRFAEQVLRLNQKSVGENESRHLVLSKPLSSYRLPLDEDQNVRVCCDCAALGEVGVHFTQSQWNKPQSRCKVCTQRQGLKRKRADVECLRAKIAAEDCNVASVLTYVLKLPTPAAIEACRAKLEEDRKEQDRRGFGLRAGFLN